MKMLGVQHEGGHYMVEFHGTRSKFTMTDFKGHKIRSTEMKWGKRNRISNYHSKSNAITWSLYASGAAAAAAAAWHYFA